MIPPVKLGLVALGLVGWSLELEDDTAGSENAGGRDHAISYCTVAVKIMESAHGFSVAN